MLQKLETQSSWPSLPYRSLRSAPTLGTAPSEELKKRSIDIFETHREALNYTAMSSDPYSPFPAK
ncbi:hypothetical protein E4U59_002632 [Claviceps monticola]|nr:hypothetical protein E4U59_002632 [Claviceps monticola]